MRTIVNALFVVAWAAAGFAAVRAIVLVFVADKRLAAACAVAVAAAFFTGAASPFVLRPLGLPPPGAAAPDNPPAPAANAPEPAAPAAAPAGADAALACPAGARPAAARARGNIDQVAVGTDAPGPPPAAVQIAAGTPLRLVGWAAEPAAAARRACALIDGAVVATRGQAGLVRDDVAAALGSPALRTAGFAVTVVVPRGRHRVGIAAVGEHDAVYALAGALNVEVR